MHDNDSKNPSCSIVSSVPDSPLSYVLLWKILGLRLLGLFGILVVLRTEHTGDKVEQ